ncbi:MAG: hypothetical protein HETSPECPRED_008579 [Heterodermia speciosa]|uniref:Uncharacterized protein n=1 Tax=Heterodermia speciosa TaxID=116794 RepID=A0A8H3IMB5_9LECA|nr:MAG: hypothetical protein HETSPECPRED_008579 [Heterodermia speciosa]
MSGASDERWRPARGQQMPPQNPSRQNNPQQRPNVSRERGGGAWQNNDRGAKEPSPYGPQEQFPSAKGFNAQEIRDALKQAYNGGGSEDDKPLKYKAPAGQANAAKQGGPWGAKRTISRKTVEVRSMLTYAANTMAGGKDFFLELRKQVSTLQQGTERAGG